VLGAGRYYNELVVGLFGRSGWWGGGIRLFEGGKIGIKCLDGMGGMGGVEYEEEGGEELQNERFGK